MELRSGARVGLRVRVGVMVRVSIGVRVRFRLYGYSCVAKI